MGLIARPEAVDTGHGTLRPDKVLAVTPAEVQETARRHIRDGEMTIVAVGDQKVIEAELAPFAGPKK